MALNLNTLRTPGVYIDEVTLLPPSVAAVETAVPVFIGYTGTPNDPEHANNYEAKIKNKAVKIASLREYELYFGKPKQEHENFQVELEVTIDTSLGNDEEKLASRNLRGARLKNQASKESSKHIMHYAMQLFYLNGGGDCYIISVGQYTQNDSIALGSQTEDGLLRGLISLESEDDPTIIVIPEANYLENDADYNTLMKNALDQSEELKDRIVLLDVKTSENIQNDQTSFRNRTIGDNLSFGAAYYPYLETIIDYYFGEEKAEKENVKISFVVKSASDLSDVTNDDAPEKLKNNDDKKIVTIKLDGLNDLYNAALNTLTGEPMPLPSSPAIAGVYNTVDRQRGVWKAPANVSIAGTVAPKVKIDNKLQESLNIDPNSGKSINAIRNLVGRGIVVWGARTLNGNDNEWRYISVRRFFNFVEESVKKATYRFVFEPNDSNTWNSIRAMIENFLTIQWNLGALIGTKPEQAFFVKVGLGQTMTPQDLNNGRLIIEIGMAVVRPAEFIILRFMHKMQEV